MRQGGAEKLAVSGFNVSTIAVIVAVLGMWLATVADQSFHLGWGWDRQILWLSPIIALGTMLVRVLGRVIFRWVGAKQ
jgi:hypothetical protein